MIAFLLRRVALALVTLGILSVIVFFGAQVLPGDPARATLGPLASQSSVDALNRELGTDRPLVTQYADWIWSFVRGDMGTSYSFRSPIAPFVMDALGASLKLAAVAFVLVVPLGILGGVVAALNVGRPLDRVISVLGLSAAAMPEFASGIVLILVFGVWLDVFPTSAAWPVGSGVLTQIYYLIMPALPLTLVLFGYIMRMTRAGTVETLETDYVRTAVLKGLPRGQVLRRHVLRNSLLPTITVVATQVGYLIGGLVVVETLFRYRGIGSLIYNAANSKDFPMLEAGVLVIGISYMLATLAADVLLSFLNPRIRLAGKE
jgi:peptide/nickel transport system permease protein